MSLKTICSCAVLPCPFWRVTWNYHESISILHLAEHIWSQVQPSFTSQSHQLQHRQMQEIASEDNFPTGLTSSRNSKFRQVRPSCSLSRIIYNIRKFKQEIVDLSRQFDLYSRSVINHHVSIKSSLVTIEILFTHLEARATISFS